MSLTAKQFKSIVRYAKSKHSQLDEHHDVEHIRRTAVLAKYLAKKEHANVDVCLAAAWLHDIGRSKSEKDHDKSSSKMAESYLKKLQLPEDFIEKVAYCIRVHHNLQAVKNSDVLEAKILYDADKLQVTGPFGFLRYYSVQHKQKSKSHKEAYRKAKAKASSVYDKKLLTAAARRLVRKEYLFLLRFYDSVEKWERIRNILKR